MAKAKEDAYYGISKEWVVTLIIWAVVSVVFLAVIVIINSTIIKLVIFSMLVMWWGIYTKWFRNSSRMRRTFFIVSYVWREWKGDTVVAKYDIPVEFLQKVIPLIDVHKGGLMEFKGKEYGILIKVNPPRIGDDELERYTRNIQIFLDGINDNLTVKTIAASKSNMVKPLVNRLNELAVDKNLTTSQKEHVYKLLEEQNERKAPIIQWEFCVYINIGIYDNLEDAIRMKDALLPGMLKNMIRADLRPRAMITNSEIGLAYRQMISQKVVEGV